MELQRNCHPGAPIVGGHRSEVCLLPIRCARYARGQSLARAFKPHPRDVKVILTTAVLVPSTVLLEPRSALGFGDGPVAEWLRGGHASLFRL